MATQPQTAINAPSGPRKPQIFTDALRAVDALTNVDERIMEAQAMPASTPVSWIRMCAGVQKVSRPMDMCQDMSHDPPIVPETMPAKMHQTVQGMDAVSTSARSPVWTWTGAPGGMVCDMGGLHA